MSRERVFETIGDAIGQTFGTGACSGHLVAIRQASDAIAASFEAAGMDSCLPCGELTEAQWDGVAYCQSCQAANPCIQQIKALGL